MACHVYDERTPTRRFGCALFRQRFSLFGGISLGLRDTALGFHMSSLWTNRRLELLCLRVKAFFLVLNCSSTASPISCYSYVRHHLGCNRRRQSKRSFSLCLSTKVLLLSAEVYDTTWLARFFFRANLRRSGSSVSTVMEGAFFLEPFLRCMRSSICLDPPGVVPFCEFD